MRNFNEWAIPLGLQLLIVAFALVGPVVGWVGSLVAACTLLLWIFEAEITWGG